MNLWIALVRLVHIFSGVFWAGSVFALARFIEPAAKATAPESNKFMQRLTSGGFTLALTVAGPLTVLAGLILYWNDSGGLQIGWITTPTGLGFTVGAIGGLIAFGFGLFVSRPAAEGMGKLGKEIQAAGKPPTPEQMSRMKAFQEKLGQATLWTAIALVVTVAAMATARYL
jgi:hypothetical protein